jgi:hypothetical protein
LPKLVRAIEGNDNDGDALRLWRRNFAFGSQVVILIGCGAQWAAAASISTGQYPVRAAPRRPTTSNATIKETGKRIDRETFGKPGSPPRPAAAAR